MVFCFGFFLVVILVWVVCLLRFSHFVVLVLVFSLEKNRFCFKIMYFLCLFAFLSLILSSVHFFSSILFSSKIRLCFLSASAIRKMQGILLLLGRWFKYLGLFFHLFIGRCCGSMQQIQVGTAREEGGRKKCHLG